MRVLNITHVCIVGLTVARIANGLGMRLIAYDPYANPNLAAAASVTLKPSLAEILRGGFLDTSYASHRFDKRHDWQSRVGDDEAYGADSERGERRND